MIFINLPLAFVLDPLVYIGPDDKNYHFRVRDAAKVVTPAEPFIWLATLVKRQEDGGRVVRLIRNLGHARKHMPPIGLPASPLMLAGM